MRDAVVAGVGMTNFGRFPSRSMRDLAREAVRGALDDAGIDVKRLQSVFAANAAAGLVTGQEMIRGQVVLQDTGIAGIPVFNIENACASGSSALHLATQAVRSGEYECVLALGVEKLSHPEKRVALNAIGSAVDVEARAVDAKSSGVSAEVLPDRSPFMDYYAAEARTLIAEMGATIEDLAQVSVKNHRHGVLNEKAQYNAHVSLADVLRSRLVVDPLTVLMCSPISDGAAAVIVMSRAMARRSSVARRVSIRASVVLSGDPCGTMPNVNRRAAAQAYEQAGIGPTDLDVIEVHDAAAPAELIAYDDLGLGAVGHALDLLRTGATTLGGRLPVNTSGGLLSRGHPIGATGLAQAVEIVQQVQGVTGSRQVDGARVGLSQNSGGVLGGDYAAAAVHIFAP